MHYGICIKVHDVLKTCNSLCILLVPLCQETIQIKASWLSKLSLSSPLSLWHAHTQAVSAVAAEDGVRFMQEMMELSSQQQKEQLPPRAIQIVSHPFFGRVVLTAGPAQFGTDLSKSSTGVSGFCSSAKLPGFKRALNCPLFVFPKRAIQVYQVFLREHLSFLEYFSWFKEMKKWAHINTTCGILLQHWTLLCSTCPLSFLLFAGTRLRDCGRTLQWLRWDQQCWVHPGPHCSASEGTVYVCREGQTHPEGWRHWRHSHWWVQAANDTRRKMTTQWLDKRIILKTESRMRSSKVQWWLNNNAELKEVLRG